MKGIEIRKSTDLVEFADNIVGLTIITCCIHRSMNFVIYIMKFYIRTFVGFLMLFFLRFICVNRTAFTGVLRSETVLLIVMYVTMRPHGDIYSKRAHR